VDAGAEDQREDRRERSRDGSEGSQYPVRRGVAAAAAQMERPARRRGLQREPHLQDDRCRQIMDETHERPAGVERVGTYRRCGCRVESQCRLCVLRQLRMRCTAGRRRSRRESRRRRGEMSNQRQRGLSIERQGRDLDARQRADRRAAHVHERDVEHVRMGVRQYPRRSDR
jgi:hypothetical protein